jgi:phage-related protein
MNTYESNIDGKKFIVQAKNLRSAYRIVNKFIKDNGNVQKMWWVTPKLEQGEQNVR